MSIQLNVLVSNDGKALIADFGVSSTDNTETMMQTVNIDTRPTSASATSVRWTAPERFHADAEPANDDYEEVKRPRKPSDIWSFGCLVYEVCRLTFWPWSNSLEGSTGHVAEITIRQVQARLPSDVRYLTA